MWLQLFSISIFGKKRTILRFVTVGKLPDVCERTASKTLKHRNCLASKDVVRSVRDHCHTAT